jgi:hypothetical protein
MQDARGYSEPTCDVWPRAYLRRLPVLTVSYDQGVDNEVSEVIPAMWLLIGATAVVTVLVLCDLARELGGRS